MAGHRNNFRSQLRVFRILVIILLFLITVGVGITIFCSIEDTVQGRGIVQGEREYQLRSSVESRITKIHHKTGDQVKAGDLLIELDDRALRYELKALEHAISELEADIAVKRSELELLKVDPLPAEYRHNSIAIQECLERVEKSEYELNIYRDLFQKRVIPEMDLKKKELEHLQNTSELKKLEEDADKLHRGLADKIINRAQEEILSMDVRLEGRKDELESMKKRIDEYRFVAPEDGTLTMMPTRIGSYVQRADHLASLATAGPKKFLMYVDEKQIYKVKEHQQIRIISSQYNYFDYGYFYADIYAIDEIPEDIGGKMYYKVRSEITVEPQPLRLGSTGQGEIIAGRGRIIRYLFGWDK